MKTTHITHQGHPARQHDFTQAEAGLLTFISDCEEEFDNREDTETAARAFAAREGMHITEEFWDHAFDRS
jgi:hypothetical protein